MITNGNANFGRLSRTSVFEIKVFVLPYLLTCFIIFCKNYFLFICLDQYFVNIILFTRTLTTDKGYRAQIAGDFLQSRLPCDVISATRSRNSI